MTRIAGILVLLIALAVSVEAAEELSADQILARVDGMLTGFQDLSLRTTMTITEKDGTRKVRELMVWQQGEKRLVKFAKPASEVGIALLATDSTTNYVYLPAYGRVRRVAAHVRNQTFMGTDLSQEDMAITSYAKDFLPKRLSENDTHWELELERKPGSSITYSRLIALVSKERSTVDRLQFFDNGGQPLKVEERSDFKFCNGKYWTPGKITMTSLKDNHQTFLENSDFLYDQNLPADFFSERSLKRPLR